LGIILTPDTSCFEQWGVSYNVQISRRILQILVVEILVVSQLI
jgi:hypothetical protein